MSETWSQSKVDALWREERPHFFKVYEDFRRFFAGVDNSMVSEHPIWTKILSQYFARLHWYIRCRDAGMLPPEKLIEQMCELRSYIMAERRRFLEPGSSELTFDKAAEMLRAMFYRAGFEPAPKIRKPQGRPIEMRHLYVTACEMQLRGMTYREIVEAKCPCSAHRHTKECLERFRKGIASVKTMLARMNQPRHRN
jgi:hypothetical protein